MEATGKLLAAGRDAEIFEHGPGRVLRRTRDGRSIEHEGVVMSHVRAFGFPVPEVLGFTDAGSGMVLERLDGPTMLDALSRRPWRLNTYAAVLARLHLQLHLIPAPEGLRQSPAGGGDRVLHLDLHPLNVMMTSRGPVVIDWSNAEAGNPAHDVAVCWITLGAADVPGGGPMARLLNAARGFYLESFLRWFDREQITAALPSALEFRVADQNLADHERAAARALVERETRR
jgi:aminoglycoside phosphotransferase (APT) family kinase protein